jgi:hypothetical protein
MLTENRLACALQESESDIIFLKSLDDKVTVLVFDIYGRRNHDFKAMVIESKSHEEGKFYAKYVLHTFKNQRISVGNEYQFNYEDFDIVSTELNFTGKIPIYSSSVTIKVKTIDEIRDEKLNSIGI